MCPQASYFYAIKGLKKLFIRTDEMLVGYLDRW